MKVSVFDTYVKKNNGSLMHFDIIVPFGTEELAVFAYGEAYLKKKKQQGALTAQQCQFCHVEQLKPQMEAEIRQHGYYIIELQGCS